MPSRPVRATAVTADVAIIGGGFTGAVAALNLADHSTRPLNITVIEPEEKVGLGVAYGTTDPDHRLNGASAVHLVSLSDPGHFTRWLVESGAVDRDPASRFGEAIFPSRSDFGAYVHGEVSTAIADGRSGSRITHCRDRASNIDPVADGVRVHLGSGGVIDSGLAVLTTSNAPPAVPAGAQSLATAENFVHDPWAPEAFAALPETGRVLIIGMGLTMADVVVSIRRDRPNLDIVAVSRRGLLPTSRGATATSAVSIADRLAVQPPTFVARNGRIETVRGLLRTVRGHAAKLESEGGSWHAAFDELRDAANVVWPRLSRAEQARFVRHVWPYYEVHRFRFAPQTERVITDALEDGSLTVEAARILGGRETTHGIEVSRRRRADGGEVTEMFDAVVNCTGPERKPRASGDPLLADLVDRGVVVPDPNQLGLIVDGLSCAIDSSGRANPRVRIVGPLARGYFGECSSSPFIVTRFNEALPSMFEVLDRE